MPSAQRTCFVISPIGPDGSEVRALANDFLELLVEPALEKYGFLVTRADRIAHPTAITTDIVRLVQESDLCLIDLTNSNPTYFTSAADDTKPESHSSRWSRRARKSLSRSMWPASEP